MRNIRDYFDKIYIINLLSRPDRRKFMIEQMKACGFYDSLVSEGKLEFVDAVVQPGLSNAMMEVFNRDNGALCNKALYMCSFEHYRTMKRALYYGYEHILILEDDACFLKDTDKFLDALDKVPADADILHLEGYYWPDGSFPTERDWLGVLSRNVEEAEWHDTRDFKLWATAAIAYTDDGLKRIVDRQEKCFRGADLYTFLEEEGSYFYTYPLFIQESKNTFKSDIMEYSRTADTTNIYQRKININDYYCASDFENIV